ncbi:MAG: hypothetical protein VB133_09450 [Anaeromusa sp.]|uniref:hypothetical protein n=1 Tax=Anaeromusa sp. TaxID=1872520 RepID=UPI002B1FB454|nr:hypothetical protein [Anaeromusa sp.]MEA4835348.1 hypothetical protein [Anaeromusa sp.]
MSDARIAKIRELQKLNENLQAQVAVLKSEKDELFGQGIKLIQELNKERELCYEHFFRWFALDKNISNILAAFRDTENSKVRELCEKIKTAQREKNEAAESVNALVGALKRIEQSGTGTLDGVVVLTQEAKLARQALAEWRENQ